MKFRASREYPATARVISGKLETFLSRNRVSRHYESEVAIVTPMDNAFARKLFQTGSVVPEALDVYREQLAAFRRKFGREMGPDDPFFFDPDADTPQFRSPSQAAYAIAVIAEMMGQAGVDAAAIYAFKRTGGLFPTETRRLSYDEELEWTAAVKEYRAQLARIPRQ